MLLNNVMKCSCGTYLFRIKACSVCKGMPAMDASYMWRNLIHGNAYKGNDDHKKINKTMMCLDNINAVPFKMWKWEFQGRYSVLIIHFRYHTSIDTMQYMINNRVFADGVPFTKHDIGYAKAIMNQGPCIYCALARAKFSRQLPKIYETDNLIR